MRPSRCCSCCSCCSCCCKCTSCCCHWHAGLGGRAPLADVRHCCCSSCCWVSCVCRCCSCTICCSRLNCSASICVSCCRTSGCIAAAPAPGGAAACCWESLLQPTPLLQPLVGCGCCCVWLCRRSCKLLNTSSPRFSCLCCCCCCCPSWVKQACCWLQDSRAAGCPAKPAGNLPGLELDRCAAAGSCG
jgi:hypothetical protein